MNSRQDFFLEFTKNFPKKMSDITALIEKLVQMNKNTRDAIIKIIAKRPNQRNQKEIESILPIVSWKTNFLRKVDKDIAIEILKKSQHLKCKRDFIITKQDGIGDSFYVIIRGSVSVYRNDKMERKPVEPEPETEPEQKLKSIKQRFRKCVKLAPFGIQENDPVEEKTVDRIEFGERINQLGSGRSFGEIALIYADTTRNATIIADEATDLLVIPRKLFNHTIKIFRNHDIQERKVFVGVHPFFNKWNEEDQKQLQMCLVKHTFPAGSSIIRQGETSSSIKFLLRGKAKILAEPAKHEQQFPELYTWYRSNQLEENIWKHLGDQKKMRIPACSTLFSEEIRSKISMGFSNTEKILHGKNVEICLLECGDMFNDLEIILDLETNIFRVACVTECEVYTLDKRAFNRLVVKRNPLTLQLMKLTAQANLNSRLFKPPGNKLEFLHILSSYINNLRIGTEGLFRESQTTRLPPLLPALSDGSRRYRVMKTNREATIDWYKRGKSPYLRSYTIGPILHKYLIFERTKCQDDTKQKSKS